jgi:hypothetical protein
MAKARITACGVLRTYGTCPAAKIDKTSKDSHQWKQLDTT